MNEPGLATLAGRPAATGMLTLDKVVVDIQSSRILRAVSLSVGAGELVCLMGRNGAGKTTTLRAIMGYLRPISGHISFKGEPMVELWPLQMRSRGEQPGRTTPGERRADDGRPAETIAAPSA